VVFVKDGGTFNSFYRFLEQALLSIKPGGDPEVNLVVCTLGVV
jgi:hypothetical protein